MGRFLWGLALGAVVMSSLWWVWDSMQEPQEDRLTTSKPVIDSPTLSVKPLVDQEELVEWETPAGEFKKQVNPFFLHRRFEKEIAGRVVTMDIIRLDRREYKASFAHDEQEPFVFEEESVVKDEAAVLVVNGGFFEGNYQPSGYLRLESEVVSSVVVPWDLGGYAVVDQEGVLEFYKQSQVSVESLVGQAVVQSFPMVMYEGRSLVSSAWKKEAFRTLLGRDEVGNSFVILSTNISFYNLGQWLEELDLGLQAVMNMDGGASSALWIEEEGYAFFVPNLSKVANVFYWTSRN